MRNWFLGLLVILSPCGAQERGGIASAEVTSVVITGLREETTIRVNGVLTKETGTTRTLFFRSRPGALVEPGAAFRINLEFFEGNPLRLVKSASIDAQVGKSTTFAFQPITKAESAASTAYAAEPANIVVPPAFARHEVMHDLYIEYVRDSRPVRKKELKPIDEEGILPRKGGSLMCDIYSLKNGRLQESRLAFQTGDSGGGRFLRLRLEDWGENNQNGRQEGTDLASAANFLMAKRPQGWRGTEEKVSSSTPIDTQTLLRMTGETSGMGAGSGRQFIRNVSSGGAARETSRTICLRARRTGLSNEDEATALEFYLELGEKHEIVGSKSDHRWNKEAGDSATWVHYQFVDTRSDAGKNPFVRHSIPFSTIAQASFKDLKDSVPSPCWQDQNAASVAFRMTALGLCAESTEPE